MTKEERREMNHVVRATMKQAGYTKYTETELRRYLRDNGLKFRVVHLHEGNTDGSVGPRGRFRYLTICEIYDPQIREREASIITEAEAACSRKDLPNKKIGRALAIGRAFKNLWEQRTFASV